MSAREGGKRIGGVTVIPLAEDVIKSLIDERIREQDIEQWAIRKWSEKNLAVHIPSISIHHTGEKQADADRGRFIIAQTEGAKFWLSVLTELQNRGMKDIFIAAQSLCGGIRGAVSLMSNQWLRRHFLVESALCVI